jgi:hypothetical protein
MSAFGPKQTSLVAPHMSALGGKADIAVDGQCALLGVSEHDADLSQCPLLTQSGNFL